MNEVTQQLVCMCVEFFLCLMKTVVNNRDKKKLKIALGVGPTTNRIPNIDPHHQPQSVLSK